VKIDFQDIRSDFEGFSLLIRLAHQVENAMFEDIDIDMSRVRWIDANMCASLGAILYKTSRNLNTISFSNIQSKVEIILCKNGFLSNYGHTTKPDVYGTTIEYKRFEPNDGRYFGTYINTHFIGKGLPRMSIGLTKKFQESIFEIFSNAAIHSETKHGIYACGQFFPKKNRLDFSITDLGIGIRQNLEEKGNVTLSAEQAIKWAVSGQNTTKSGRVPGGLGLKLLREFISMNHGRIQIASDQGYWELKENKETLKRFTNPFPGTTVNLEFNTADTKSYHLAAEIRPEEIF
jgi:hypothetical protein